MTLSLHYDRPTDAAYLRFSTEPIVESEEVSPGVVLDFDVEGRLVAMEVLEAAKRLPKDVLIAAE
jgi:uncharacterized protein YuzE